MVATVHGQECLCYTSTGSTVASYLLHCPARSTLLGRNEKQKKNRPPYLRGSVMKKKIPRRLSASAVKNPQSSARSQDCLSKPCMTSPTAPPRQSARLTKPSAS